MMNKTCYVRRFVALILLLFVMLLDITNCSTTYDIKATLTELAKSSLEQWIRQGGRTRLDIKPHFDPDLGLPAEALLCNDDGNAEKNRGIDTAQIMFDWCHWEWEIEGNYGVWDDDFRYEIYSMGISTWAKANLTVRVSFGELASNESKSFFQNCLSLSEQVREVANAIKLEIDLNHESIKTSTDAPINSPTYTIKKNVNESLCETKWDDRFGRDLNSKTILCFHALRPTDDNSNYTESAEKIFTNQTYHLSLVCLRGVNELQTWLSVIRRDDSLSLDLSTEISSFEIAILLLLVLFLPLLILKIFPCGADVMNDDGHGSVNILNEEAHFILSEKERRKELINEGLEDISMDNVKVHDTLNRTIKDRCEVTFSLKTRTYGEGMVTLSKTRDESIPWCWANCFKILLLSTLEGAKLAWNWQAKITRDFPSEEKKDNGQSYVIDRCDDTNNIKFQYHYVPLNCSTPSLIGFTDCLAGRGAKWMSPFARGILLTLTRSFFIIFASWNAMVLMMILDAAVFSEQIQRLIQFREKNQVEVNDLGYWNYFSTTYRILPLANGSSIRWDILYPIICVYWCCSVLTFSFPGVTSYCIKGLYPSRFFGSFNIVKFPHRHMFGTRLVCEGLLKRLGFIFEAAFWQRWRQEVFSSDNGKISAWNVFKGVLSLVCVVSAFPMIAILPPLYSWNSKYWPKMGIIFILASPSIAILICLSVLTLKIYLRFFLFTITALVFHYQVTLGIFGIAVGSLGFLASLQSQIKNSYLADKMLMLGVITEVHNERVLQNELRDKTLKWNKNHSCQQIHVPELIYFWRQESWPCIPKKLHDKVVERLRPLGRQRIVIFIKIAVMAIFAALIYTVMKAMGMNNNNSGFDAIKMVITVVAVNVPTFIAKLRSTQASAVREMQRKGIVRQEVELFLEDNKEFYCYNFGEAVMDREENKHPTE